MSLYQKQKAEEEGGEQNWILRIWLAHIFIKYTTAIIAIHMYFMKVLIQVKNPDFGFSIWIIHHIFVELLWLLVFLGISSKAKNTILWYRILKSMNINHLPRFNKKKNWAGDKANWKVNSFIISLLKLPWGTFAGLLTNFQKKTIWPEYVHRILFFKPC